MNFMGEYLRSMCEQDLQREPAVYEAVDATHVRQNEREYLLLASNNYLGLTHHPAVRQAAADAALRHGTGSGGSRLTTGTYPLYSALERDLAAFKRTEAALVFNTGYMANVGSISALAGPDDAVFSDELNHASIIDGCRLSRANVVVYRHCDMAHLAELLQTTLCRGHRLIVTDGVFSMDGDIAPLDKITALADRHHALVMVDDAHSTGVIGEEGHGTAAYFGLADRIDVQMGTLSKALASEGGYVAGSAELIRFLINKARSFIFSTALSPATIAAAQAALNILRDHPGMVARLAANAAVVRERLRLAGFQVGSSVTPIIPVLIGEAKKAVELAAALREEGLIISAIRPPTVAPGTSRLRLTVTAAHEPAELAAAAEKIIAAGRRLGILRE